ALQITIARHRPEWKESPISVITQIEHTGEARGGISLLFPQAVIALIFGEIRDAASNSRMLHLACRHQTEKRPCGLRGRARRLLVAAIVQLVARSVLAPAAVLILDRSEPLYRPAKHRRLSVHARGVERAQHRPGAVDVIHAPTAVPAPVD